MPSGTRGSLSSFATGGRTARELNKELTQPLFAKLCSEALQTSIGGEESCTDIELVPVTREEKNVPKHHFEKILGQRVKIPVPHVEQISDTLPMKSLNPFLTRGVSTHRVPFRLPPHYIRHSTREDSGVCSLRNNESHCRVKLIREDFDFLRLIRSDCYSINELAQSTADIGTGMALPGCASSRSVTPSVRVPHTVDDPACSVSLTSSLSSSMVSLRGNNDNIEDENTNSGDQSRHATEEESVDRTAAFQSPFKRRRLNLGIRGGLESAMDVGSISMIADMSEEKRKRVGGFDPFAEKPSENMTSLMVPKQVRVECPISESIDAVYTTLGMNRDLDDITGEKKMRGPSILHSSFMRRSRGNSNKSGNSNNSSSSSNIAKFILRSEEITHMEMAPIKDSSAVVKGLIGIEEKQSDHHSGSSSLSSSLKKSQNNDLEPNQMKEFNDDDNDKDHSITDEPRAGVRFYNPTLDAGLPTLTPDKLSRLLYIFEYEMFHRARYRKNPSLYIPLYEMIELIRDKYTPLALGNNTWDIERSYYHWLRRRKTNGRSNINDYSEKPLCRSFEDAPDSNDDDFHVAFRIRPRGQRQVTTRRQTTNKAKKKNDANSYRVLLKVYQSLSYIHELIKLLKLNQLLKRRVLISEFYAFDQTVLKQSKLYKEVYHLVNEQPKLSEEERRLWDALKNPLFDQTVQGFEHVKQQIYDGNNNSTNNDSSNGDRDSSAAGQKRRNKKELVEKKTKIDGSGGGQSSLSSSLSYIIPFQHFPEYTDLMHLWNFNMGKFHEIWSDMAKNMSTSNPSIKDTLHYFERIRKEIVPKKDSQEVCTTLKNNSLIRHLSNGVLFGGLITSFSNTTDIDDGSNNGEGRGGEIGGSAGELAKVRKGFKCAILKDEWLKRLIKEMCQDSRNELDHHLLYSSKSLATKHNEEWNLSLLTMDRWFRNDYDRRQFKLKLEKQLSEHENRLEMMQVHFEQQFRDPAGSDTSSNVNGGGGSQSSLPALCGLEDSSRPLSGSSLEVKKKTTVSVKMEDGTMNNDDSSDDRNNNECAKVIAGCVNGKQSRILGRACILNAEERKVEPIGSALIDSVNVRGTKEEEEYKSGISLGQLSKPVVVPAVDYIDGSRYLKVFRPILSRSSDLVIPEKCPYMPYAVSTLFSDVVERNQRLKSTQQRNGYMIAPLKQVKNESNDRIQIKSEGPMKRPLQEI